MQKELCKTWLNVSDYMLRNTDGVEDYFQVFLPQRKPFACFLTLTGWMN